MSMLSGIIRTQETSILPIAKIRRDGGTQPRDGIDLAHVADIRQAIRDRVDLPAIEVTYDGQHYWLWDGYHRTEAHEAEGLTEIEAIVHQGNLEDAQWASYGVNKAHGLKRSTADKERAIRSALKHMRAAGMSDRALAEHLGVSDKTVGKYRAEMELTAEIPQSTERTGADGRKLNTANIGKRPYGEASNEASRRINRANRLVRDHHWGFLHHGSGGGVDAEHSVLTNGKYVPFATDEEAIEFAEAKQREADGSTPALRPLTADETMSLVWRVVKSAKLPIATTPATTGQRWRQYRDWLSRYTVAADYSHEAPAGTQLDRQTLADARNAIIAELDKNIGMVRGVAEVAGVDIAMTPDQAALMLHMPPFPIADKDLFMGQVKRSITLLDEEGYASAADFLRSVYRNLDLSIGVYKKG